MGTRLNAIREACRLAPDLRSEENVNDILEFVRDVKFFEALTSLQQRTLCKMMSLETFEPRVNIFEVGDVGDKYYIILSGSVSVQVPSLNAPCPNGIHEGRCTCKNRPLETTVFLAKGSGFGELALQEDKPRSATIQTSERTEALVITRTNYEKYAGELHKLFIEQRVKFLRQCPLIEQALQQGSVTPPDLAAMANCLNERSLNGNQLVVRQGEPVESMIFVRSGSLAMLKLVDVDGKESRRPRAPDSRMRGKVTKTKAGQEPDAPVADGQGATNLAKAILEMKRVDRDKALAASFLRNSRTTRRESMEDAAQFAQQVFGRRASFEQEERPKMEPQISNRSSKASQPSQSQALWGKLRATTNQAMTLKKTAEALGSEADKAETETKTTGVYKAFSAVSRKQEPKKKLLLRVGSVGAFQYFGDKEVCNSQVFPCSLMSDPIADIYIMSKHDVLRRLPKSLLSALFTQDVQKEPTDGQLVDMLRQNERWFTFRRSMHGEVLMCRDQERGGGARAYTSTHKVDALSNFEFLGVNPHGSFAGRTLPPPRKILGVHLTAKDEELFSQTSARFLRRFDHLKRDRGLRVALRKAGASERLLSSIRQDALDPMQIRFDQQWSKLQQDPVSLDLDQENLEDLFRIPSADEMGDGQLAMFAAAFAFAPRCVKTLLPGQVAERGDSDFTGRWNTAELGAEGNLQPLLESKRRVGFS
ncbi:unnamed protein product [Effrenium voratum]|uniref:Cyclic nucleotide-binding domain-containing protein n=1 Tax=Effrenium voratum TaxID=2562239 RepID=A0AA36MZ13_9DINO|nr:unnamed protein product [Effrenium voratum]CAJ1391974.1 unnamed protein product [Effrenium voratum]